MSIWAHLHILNLDIFFLNVKCKNAELNGECFRSCYRFATGFKIRHGLTESDVSKHKPCFFAHASFVMFLGDRSYLAPAKCSSSSWWKATKKPDAATTVLYQRNGVTWKLNLDQVLQLQSHQTDNVVDGFTGSLISASELGDLSSTAAGSRSCQGREKKFFHSRFNNSRSAFCQC